MKEISLIWDHKVKKNKKNTLSVHIIVIFLQPLQLLLLSVAL